MSYFTWFLIIAISLICVYGCYIIVQLSFDAHKQNIVAGKEALIGEEGEVVSVHHDKIIVRVLGELWSADSPHQLHVHQAIKVVKLKGLLLTVEPL